jgi:hypothetical protein
LASKELLVQLVIIDCDEISSNCYHCLTTLTNLNNFIISSGKLDHIWLNIFVLNIYCIEISSSLSPHLLGHHLVIFPYAVDFSRLICCLVSRKHCHLIKINNWSPIGMLFFKLLLVLQNFQHKLPLIQFLILL